MKKYHHCVKFTYPLSFQTRIPKVDQHTGGKWLRYWCHNFVWDCISGLALEFYGDEIKGFVMNIEGFVMNIWVTHSELPNKGVRMFISFAIFATLQARY